MVEHRDILAEMGRVRTAIAASFPWFVHESPEQFLTSIRDSGLLANRDAPAPPEVEEHFGERRDSILCLHPLGARLVPRGAASTLCLPIGQDPKVVRFAISATDLPATVGLDWSYDWSGQLRYMRSRGEDAVDDIALALVREYGCVASYDGIPAAVLRVCCLENDPQAPADWPLLSEVEDGVIARFD